MDRELLNMYLEEGLSLEKIGKRLGCDPRNVGYWVQKHGLRAVNSDKHAPKGAITREELEPLLEAGMSLRKVADHLGVSPSTVRYWTNKHALPSGFAIRRADATAALRSGDRRKQDDCRHHGPTEFFLDARGSWRCAKCRSEAVSRRRRKVKMMLVDEFGGSCRLCGYNRYVCALHFHHLDPTEKSFAISRKGETRSIEVLREEAKKCVLLCSNCHAEVEAGVTDLPIK